MEWVLALGVTNVEIESDSLMLVQAIKRSTVYFLEVGNILQDMICLLRIGTISLFRLLKSIKKQAITVAHMLARVPCEVNSFVDFSSPPFSVLESILYDVQRF